MILSFGLTEIIGAHSSGKTSLALYAVNDKPTLYISCSIFCHKALPQNFTIIRLNSFLKLKIFLASKDFFLKMFECIIIDTLEEFLYVFDKQKRNLIEIARISKILKNLIFKYNIKVIITNYYYEHSKIDGYGTFNPYLGFRWSYVPNSRYLITKKDDEREVKQLLGNNTKSFNFKITLLGIKMVQFVNTIVVHSLETYIYYKHKFD